MPITSVTPNPKLFQRQKTHEAGKKKAHAFTGLSNYILSEIDSGDENEKPTYLTESSHSNSHSSNNSSDGSVGPLGQGVLMSQQAKAAC